MEDAETPTKTDSAYYIVGALVVIGVLCAAIVASPRLFSLTHGSGVPQEAPDVALPYIANGEGTFHLASLKGKPVLLDFWASWCGPCRAEGPIVHRVADEYAAQGLATVSIATSDDADAAEEFIGKHAVPFAVVYDTGNRAARAFGVDSLPTLVVLSKDGKVAAVRNGFTSREDLEHLVKDVL